MWSQVKISVRKTLSETEAKIYVRVYLYVWVSGWVCARIENYQVQIALSVLRW